MPPVSGFTENSGPGKNSNASPNAGRRGWTVRDLNSSRPLSRNCNRFSQPPSINRHPTVRRAGLSAGFSTSTRTVSFSNRRLSGSGTRHAEHSSKAKKTKTAADRFIIAERLQTRRGLRRQPPPQNQSFSLWQPSFPPADPGPYTRFLLSVRPPGTES